MFVSILICTRNRCAKLRGALRSLVQLQVGENTSFEVVVVDNGSTDCTPEVCREFSASLPIRHLLERRRGKSAALARGIAAALGDVVAFTDDDCIVAKSWLHEIVSAFMADEALAVAGGRVELYQLSARNFTTTTHSSVVEVSARPVHLFEPLIIGANVAIRADVLKAIGSFDLKLGPGSRLEAVAEDMDYVYRAYLKKFKIVYFPQIVVYHDHGRTTDPEIEALLYRYYVGRAAVFTKHLLRGEVLRPIYWDLRNVVKHDAKQLFERQLDREERMLLPALLIGVLSRLRRA